MQQDQWHYKDERSGKRLGPVTRDQVGEMIAADRIERATLVWNPAMPEWAAASTTDLAALFGDGPPPLPASEISRWAVYALALFPLVGLAIQAIASAVISARNGSNVQEVLDHRAWLLLFVVRQRHSRRSRRTQPARGRPQATGCRLHGGVAGASIYLRKLSSVSATRRV